MPIPHKDNNHVRYLIRYVSMDKSCSLACFVLKIPPTSDSSNPTGLSQWESATTNPAIHGCSCLWCSAIRHNDPPARRTVEYQERWPPSVSSIHSEVSLRLPWSNRDRSPKNTVTPYVSQTLLGENTAEIGAIVNGQTQASFVAPQAPVCNRAFRFLISS